jgi:hypothetical protein
MMRSKAAGVFACVVVSFVIAGFLGPGDPDTWNLWSAVISVVTVLFYWLGIRYGRHEAQRPNRQVVGRRRAWLQFSLGTLLVIVTAAAIFMAGWKWHRQLEDRAAQIDGLAYLVGEITSRHMNKVPVWMEGGRGDGEASPIAASNWYWEIPPNCLPKGLVETMAAELADELRQDGMEVRVFDLGGESPTIESCGGKRIDYHNADVGGTIVLRHVVPGDQNSANFLFIDRSQFFRKE